MNVSTNNNDAHQAISSSSSSSTIASAPPESLLEKPRGRVLSQHDSTSSTSTAASVSSLPVQTEEPFRSTLAGAQVTGPRGRWTDAGAGRALELLQKHCPFRLPPEIWGEHVAKFLCFAAPVEGCVYVCGGRCSKVMEPRHYLSSVEMLCPFRNEWLSLPPMSTSRVGAASVELNGQLFVIGGYKTHPDDPLASGEKFDPITGKWSAIADMNKARFGHAMAAVDDRFIFVMGGDSHRALVNDIERYDAVTDSWTRVGTLSAPVAGGRMLERDGKLYLVGGDVGTQPLSFTDKLRIFDTRTGKWDVAAQGLTIGRSACAVTWCGDGQTIAVMGGYAADGEHFFELASGEAIALPSEGAAQSSAASTDGNRLQQRRAIPPLPEPRAGCRSVTIGNKVIVVGGESPASPPRLPTATVPAMAMPQATPMDAETADNASDASMNEPDADHAHSDDETAQPRTPAPQQRAARNPNPAFLRDLRRRIAAAQRQLALVVGNNQAQVAAAAAIAAAAAAAAAANNGAADAPAMPVEEPRARRLHAEVMVFDSNSWSWESANSADAPPPMSIARTAAAVCVGRGFPRSFAGNWGSQLRWMTADACDDVAARQVTTSSG